MITFINTIGMVIKKTSLIRKEDCMEDSFILDLNKYEYIPAQWEGVVYQTKRESYCKLRCFLCRNIFIKEIQK